MTAIIDGDGLSVSEVNASAAAVETNQIALM